MSLGGTMRILCVTFGLALAAAAPAATAQTSPRPAVPTAPIAAIANALTTHTIIGLGEGAHNGEQDAAFRLALIRDSTVIQRADDIVTECGNSRYQSVIDEYIRGGEVPYSTLRRVWEDSIVATPVCDSVVYQNFYREVRDVNSRLPRDEQWRVILGGPPIDWDAVKTFDDITKFEAGRDRFIVDVIRREVLNRGRRAIVMYGRIHIALKNERTNYESDGFLAAQLEAEGVKVFKIWTAVAGMDLGQIQKDVPRWRIPSLALIRGTALGAADFMAFFPSDGRLAIRDGKVARIPREEWRPMRMEDQVDAMLYLGPTVTYSALPHELCTDAAYLDRRFSRLALIPDGQGEIARLKQYCSSVVR